VRALAPVVLLAILLAPLLGCSQPNKLTPCQHDATILMAQDAIEGVEPTSVYRLGMAFLASCNESFKRCGDYDHSYVNGRCE
jgi:hypothetical protein